MTKDIQNFIPRKLYDGHIPFGSDGSPHGYTSQRYPESLGSGTWRPNTPFPANLRLADMERGRSAAHFIWKDEQNRRYVMFMTDLLDLIQNFDISHGVVNGNWAFTKRGQNFGVIYLGPTKVDASDGGN